MDVIIGQLGDALIEGILYLPLVSALIMILHCIAF